MLRFLCCLIAVLIVPSLASAQATPPPAVKGVKIDPARADPMPQGITELLVFSGQPTKWRPPPSADKVSAPIKGLSPADKLALVRRAASTNGSSATGSAMRPYMMLTRAVLSTPQGAMMFAGANAVRPDATVIGSGPAGFMFVTVQPGAPGSLYLLEIQAAGPAGAARGIACHLQGPGGSDQSFRLTGATTIIPAVFTNISTDYHDFVMFCDSWWQFNSVEVSVLR